MGIGGSTDPLHSLFLIQKAALMAKLYSALLLTLFSVLCSSGSMGEEVFREYIGALYNGVKFTDMPINPGTKVDFILAFAIDYTASSDPTDGKFNIFWDSENLSPTAVEAIKSQHENVRVAVSLGGDTVGSAYAQFKPSSVTSWVSNAVSSLTEIIKEYHLDGIDIDYEHFDFSDSTTFADCIGQLITQLKQNKVISFASIAPFADEVVQSHYSALWNEYGNVIDYVNFQFYAYDSRSTVSQFIEYFDAQESRYSGGKVLTSFTSGGSRGLSPANGFFEACETLKESGKLSGIFAWCADSSLSDGFKYETQAQALLQGS